MMAIVHIDFGEEYMTKFEMPFPLKGAIENLAGELHAATDKLKLYEERMARAHKLFEEYFKHYDCEHEEYENDAGDWQECPLDDTCTCPLVQGINEAFKLLENK
jgi:hypothetical protein